MLKALLVLVLGLVPALASWWLMRRAEANAQARLRAVLEEAAAIRLRRIRLSMDQDYIEGVGYLMGDITCRFNARSTYLRCAVNPSGPCEECSHYQSVELKP